MGGKPRNFGIKEHRPSPLKQEVSQRPISMQSPSMGLVRDPMFWKRFSTAVHMSEVDLKEIESGFASERLAKRKVSSGSSGDGDWLDQQYKEKRQCRLICLGVTFAVAIIVAAAVVVVLHFTGRIRF
ncbi:hypothetical protein DSL72_000566 [Monilinia vaccinii-corymbosi]|uniref:Uncharacterized protein n=1 Tax=Monilinia vaccinii-corymbosi TaxID=61207 RepID=A0A8A3NZB7_9HELO|nr:hypothetical protein DSL72_000566 [Monilinia vaccinii-corymbosi]